MAVVVVSLLYNASVALNTVPSDFLSFNIDAASIYYNFSFGEPKLAQLLSYLSPAVLRVGGTAADFTFYHPNTTNTSDGHGNVTLSNAMWDSIVGLASAANMDLLYDLFVAPRAQKKKHPAP